MVGKLKIALCGPASREDIQKYHSYMTSECEIVAPKSSKIEDLIKVARDADVLVGIPIPQRVIDAAEKLKMVQLTHTGPEDHSPGGTDNGFYLRSLKNRGILLGNLHGRSRIIVEEYFAILLALAKRLVPKNKAISNGEYYARIPEHYSVFLRGKTLGLLGFGHLGYEWAKIAKAFDMRILAITAHPEKKRGIADKLGVEFLGSQADLYRVLRESDFVAIILPLTEETIGLIGEKELKVMKKTAYLIGGGRAKIIQEDALFKALTEGWIAGFGSAVWWNYGFHDQLPSMRNIHKLPNVLAIGDYATLNLEGIGLAYKLAFENIDQFAKGEKPQCLVDFDRLY